MKGVFASLAAALVIIIVLFYGLYGTVNDVATEKNPEKLPQYHVQIITQNTDEHFWTMFKKGASAAGVELNTYVEFVDVAQNDTNTSVQTVEKAIYSKVDGIALQAQDATQTTTVLKTAKTNKIAALTFENEFDNIPEFPTVGSNSYDIGQKQGQMAIQACNGKGNVAIIVNGASKEKSQNKNLKLQGILDTFSKYAGMSSHTYQLESGTFETEKLMNTILAQNPKVNLIICTDERSTPGVAQVIRDTNRVGDISIIGYGAMPQTLSFIEKGVIYGAVCPDAYQIGYHVVAELCSVLDKKQVTDSFNTDLFSINKTNVDKYKVKPDEK